MLALLSARFRRLMIFMIAVPIGGRLLEAVGRRLEHTAGPTRASRTMRSAGRTAGRFSRGPLRSRYAPEPQAAPPPGSGLNGQGGAKAGRRSGRR